jgi:hypothetical protein
VAVLFVLAGIGAASLLARRGDWELRLVPASPGATPAVLASSTIERKLGFVTVTGSVTSYAARPLRNVQAVVELLDARSHPVQVEAALLPYSSLAPGQTAPFRVEVTDSAAVKGYRVTFAELDSSEAP